MLFSEVRFVTTFSIWWDKRFYVFIVVVFMYKMSYICAYWLGIFKSAYLKVVCSCVMCMSNQWMESALCFYTEIMWKKIARIKYTVDRVASCYSRLLHFLKIIYIISESMLVILYLLRTCMQFQTDSHMPAQTHERTLSHETNAECSSKYIFKQDALHD